MGCMPSLQLDQPPTNFHPTWAGTTTLLESSISKAARGTYLMRSYLLARADTALDVTLHAYVTRERVVLREFRMFKVCLRAALLTCAATTAANATCDAPPDRADAGKIFRPIAGEYRLTDGFGLHRHPLLGIIRAHEGIDYLAPIGTPVIAAGYGEIIAARRNGEFGNYIAIRHQDDTETEYAHLVRFAPEAAPGKCVSVGTVIGYVGTTGLSAEPHLHFGLRIAGRLVDPIPYLTNPGSGSP